MPGTIPHLSESWDRTDARLAYCAQEAYSDSPCVIDSNHVRPFNKLGQQGFVAWNSHSIVVSIRGSDEKWDWVRNVSATSIDYEPGLSFHLGFLTAAGITSLLTAELVRELLPERRLYITGHSLGGAVAGILGHMWRDMTPARITTFGAPRFVRRGGESNYKQPLMRYVNYFDPVPIVPLLTYKHVGSCRYVRPLRLARQHSMKRYLEWMEREWQMSL